MRLMQSTQGCFLAVSEVARRVGVSERVLRGAFRTGVGESPKQFQLGARLDMARDLLRSPNHRPGSVAEAMERLGFSHAGRFSKLYRQRFGIPPGVELTRPARQITTAGWPAAPLRPTTLGPTIPETL